MVSEAVRASFTFSVCYAWCVCWLLAFDERERVFGVAGWRSCYCCWLILCLYFVSLLFFGCRCLPPISKMLLVFFLCFCKELCVECIAHTSCIVLVQFVLWTLFKWFFLSFDRSERVRPLFLSPSLFSIAFQFFFLCSFHIHFNFCRICLLFAPDFLFFFHSCIISNMFCLSFSADGNDFFSAAYVFFSSFLSVSRNCMRFSNETQKDVICEQSKNYARISLFPCLFREKKASVCVYVFLHLTPTAFTEYDESFFALRYFFVCSVAKVRKICSKQKNVCIYTFPYAIHSHKNKSSVQTQRDNHERSGQRGKKTRHRQWCERNGMANDI